MEEVTNAELVVSEKAALQQNIYNGDPRAIVAEATDRANVLKDIVERQKLFKQIGPGKHLLVEAWQIIGAFHGVGTSVTNLEEIREDGVVIGAKATAAAVRLSTGETLATAIGFCLNKEKKKAHEDWYALSSMAQTRACSRVLRQMFAWIVALAGYETTPAEEMKLEYVQQQPSQSHKQAPAPTYSASPADKETIDNFVKVCVEITKLTGVEEPQAKFMTQSDGRFPTIDRIAKFNTPKQVAWIKKIYPLLQDELYATKREDSKATTANTNSAEFLEEVFEGATSADQFSIY